MKQSERDTIIYNILVTMYGEPKTQFNLDFHIQCFFRVSSGEIYMLLKYMVEENLIRYIAKTDRYMITSKGYYLVEDIGNFKYTKEKLKREKLKIEAETAGLKMKIYNKKTRYITVFSIVFAGITLLISIISLLI